MKCRIKRCEQDARWIVWSEFHPNGDLPRTPYCHEHAEQSVKLLWDESPRAYRMHAEGPHDKITAVQL